MGTVDELAATIADIFQTEGWTWGLDIAGIPESVPDTHDIARKIDELLAKDAAIVRAPMPWPWLVSDARIVLASNNPPPYDKHVRVLLHIGDIPQPERTTT